MRSINKLLFTPIDNSALLVFRVFFGLLITLEAWGAIATGWVRRVMVTPEFTFNFIGFDFLQVFPGVGPQMYAWYALMGVFGALVMVGYKYRIAIIGYGIMWAAVYLMQKSSYNNHYYLLMLLCGIMAVFPAHKNLSVDAYLNPKIKENSMPRWVVLVIILQLWIVYSYAAIAKLYPDWLDATVPRLLMLGRKDYWLVGDLLQQEWVHYSIAYIGILFDGLIIPALLFKKTRKWAFGISIFFHLFNSIVFQIGIFPYMSLAFTLFFFDPKTIYTFFRLRFVKPFYDGGRTRTQNTMTLEEPLTNVSLEAKPPSRALYIPSYRTVWIVLFAIYFSFQIALPLRHWFIPDDVLWTEEGHRLSWRMMLRTKSNRVRFMGEDKATGKRFPIDHKSMLTKNQYRSVGSKPDFMWQFAQRLKKKYALEGKDVAIYAISRVRVNGRSYQKFTNDSIDLASVDWKWATHHEWILPSGDYLEKEEE